MPLRSPQEESKKRRREPTDDGVEKKAVKWVRRRSCESYGRGPVPAPSSPVPGASIATLLTCILRART